MSPDERISMIARGVRSTQPPPKPPVPGRRPPWVSERAEELLRAALAPHRRQYRDR